MARNHVWMRNSKGTSHRLGPFFCVHSNSMPAGLFRPLETVIFNSETADAPQFPGDDICLIEPSLLQPGSVQRHRDYEVACQSRLTPKKGRPHQIVKP